MQPAARKRRGAILASVLLAVLLLAFCGSNLWYWRRLQYISRSYADSEYPACHVTRQLLGDGWDRAASDLPRLAHTRVPITAQPKTPGVKILQVVYCEERSALYCAVRYPVSLSYYHPFFRLRVDGEPLRHCDHNTTVDGFPYTVHEFTFDLSEAPPATPDNTALELCYFPARGEEAVLLERIAE